MMDFYDAFSHTKTPNVAGAVYQQNVEGGVTLDVQGTLLAILQRLNNLNSGPTNSALSDRQFFQKHTQIMDGRNIQLGIKTGTKLGTATTQKLSVYGVIPIVQAGAIGAPNSQQALYSQVDAQSIVTAVNSIRTALKNFGITA